MKHYLPLCALVASAALFVGCKSGTAPTATPAPAPVTKEAPKTPAPTDAQGILKLASENSLNAKSVSSEVLIDAEVMGRRWPSVILNIVKYDDVLYLNSELGGMPLEGYSNGKVLVLMDPMSRRWQRLPPEQADILLPLLNLIVQQKVYSGNLNNVSFSNEEKIQEKSYYIVEATINPEASSKILANPLMENLDVKFDKTSLKTWIEKDSYLICKTEINMEATLSGDIPGMPGTDIEDEEEPADSKAPAGKPEESKTARIKYEIEVNNSDYNKVAPIVIPPEAKSLLETSVAPVNK